MRRQSDIRALPAILCMVAVFMLVVGWLTWIYASQVPDALSARILPLKALEYLSDDLANASGVQIPWLAVLITGVWFGGLLSLGNAISSRISGATPSRIPWPARFALGYLAIGLLVYIAGLAGLATPWAMLALMGFLLAVAVGGMAIHRPRVRISGHFRRYLLMIIIAVPAFLVALTPPVQSDGMRYHLGAPQEFLKNGAISFLPHNAFSNFPFLPQMHYMIALGCGQPEAAQLMHWAVWLVTGAGVYHIGRRIAVYAGHGQQRRQAALLASALYLCLPLSPVLASWPFIDHSVSLFILLSTWFVGRMCIQASPANTVWAGLMCGGAVGCKYTAVVHVIALAVLAIFLLKDRLRFLRTALTFALVLTLSGSVWYFRNWIVAGNPVYPLAHSIFQGGDWTVEAAKRYSDSAGLKGIPKTLGNLWRSPVESAVSWIDLDFEKHNFATGLGICLSLLIAALLTRPTRLIILFIATGVLYWITWFFSYQSNRMLLPLAALCLPLLPLLLCSVHNRILVRIGKSALIVLVGYGWLWSTQWMFFFTALSPPPLRYLTDQYTRDQYLGKSLSYYHAFSALNRNQPSSKTLLIGEHRIFYAEFDAVWSDWFDTPAFAAFVRENQVTSLPDLLEAFKRHNIGQVLINDEELKPQMDIFRSRHTDQELQILDDFRAATSNTARRYGGVTIYSVEEQ